MSGIVWLVGEAGAVLAADLRAASFKVETQGAGTGATLLVTLTHTAEAAIAAARAFAEAEVGVERLIIHAWHVPGRPDWETRRQAAIMAAFTRYAAAAWARRRLRVNAVTMASAGDGAGVMHNDLAATVLAILRWPSMTGQLVHLATAGPPRDSSPGRRDRPQVIP